MAENKERLIETKEGIKDREIKVTEFRRQTEEAPPEIKKWIERIEEDPTKMQQVNDVDGQPLLQTASPQQPKIVLPITRTTFVAGFKKKVDEASRWLSTFVLRLIKIKGGKVKFKEE
jgi:hypothetical protein